MTDSVWIVGQGIAGSMLAAECERAGVAFRIFDAGHAAAASRVGVGLLSPLTGRRLVPSWQFAEVREEVLACYRSWEETLGRRLVRELRIRRLYRDDAQRELWRSRLERPEVARWIASHDEEGLWLCGALQVETGEIIAALRERWLQAGCLEERLLGPAEIPSGQRVIWCTGAQAVPGMPIPWEPSRGELVRGRMDGLEADFVRNDGHWLLPDAMGDGMRVGSTFDREDLDAGVTAAGQAELREAAVRLGGQALREPRGDSGLRVTVPDRRPVAGWWDEARTQGILAGMAAKGALWAPWLAAQWLSDGLAGNHLEPQTWVRRFHG